MSPHRIRARARDVGRALDRSHVPETFTAILCVGLTLLGLDMLRDPTSYSERATFHVAVMKGTFHGLISAHTPTEWNSV